MQFDINRTHIVLVSLVVLLVGAMVGEYYWLNSQLTTANTAAQKAREEANLAIGKAQTLEATQKQLNTAMASMSKEIQDAIKKSGEQVTQFLSIIASSKSSGQGKLVVVDTNASKPNLSMDKPNGQSITITPARFRFQDYRLTADIDISNNDFKYVLEQKLSLQIVQTSDSSGIPISYAEISELDDKGKQVNKWTIDRFESLVLKPKDKQWYWWAFKINLQGSVGADFTGKGRAMFGIGFSPFAYGLTKNDNMLRLLNIGASYDGQYPVLTLSPVGYNLGQVIPLITDLWVWPTYGIGSSQMVLISIGKTL